MTRFFPRTAKPTLRRGSFVSLTQLEDRSVPAIFANATSQTFGSALNNNGHVAAGDFNGDGIADLVLTNYGSSKAGGTDDPGQGITVMFGTGTGSFTGATKYLAGGSASDFVSFAAVADLNGDSKLDIVSVQTGTTAAGSASSFTVYLNSGTGTFTSTNTATGGANATWVGLADLNGDTVKDLAITHLGRDAGSSIDKNNVTIYTGNSTAGKANGTFNLSNTYTTNFEFIPTAGAFIDIDTDGDLDLAVTIPNAPPDETAPQVEGKIGLLTNTGGLFAIGGSYPASGGLLPISIVAADVDNNGKMDLVVGNAGDPDNDPSSGPNSSGTFGQGTSAAVLTNNGFGGFSTKSVLTTSLRSAFAVAAGDFNLDGNIDIAVADIGAPLGIDLSTFQFFAEEAGSLAVFTGNGTGAFGLDFDHKYSNVDTQYLAIADFDGKGNPDIVTVGLENRVRTHLNSTRPTATTLSASTNTAVSGTNITFTGFTALTGGYSENPIGSVDFYDGATKLGSDTLFLVSTKYEASITVSNLSVGTHSITAKYTGQYASSPFFGTSVSTPQVVTITAGGNTTPTISGPTDQTITTVGAGSQNFTVGDAETPAAALVVTKSSSNLSVIPLANIILGGTAANRTVQVNGNGVVGSSTITLTVTDGSGLTAQHSFVVTTTASNSAPTISNFGDQSVTAGQTLGPIGFTINDAESAATSLIISAVSSNTGLIPSGAITFGGSGANRTFSIASMGMSSGTTTVTVTVSDGSLTASDTFVLTVNGANTAPTLSDILDQTTTTGTNVGPLSFTVDDGQTAAGSLTVSATSSNTTLIPTGNIFFGGSAASRTVLLSPAAGQNGTSTITVTVSDGTLTATDTFVITVSSPNSAPTISDIGNQSTTPGTSVGPIGFTVDDAQSVAGTLTVRATSSNTALLANANILFGGSGASRTVLLAPTAGQSGTSMVTVTVSDGSLTATDTFVLTVTGANTAPTISDTGNQAIILGASPAIVAFTVGDAETTADALVVTASSSNGAVISASGAVLGGSGSGRTFTLNPSAAGTTTITLTVSDGTTTTSDNFIVTVLPAINQPPVISPIADRTIVRSGSTGPIAFTITDPDAGVEDISVELTSSNTVLVPLGNMVLTGGGGAPYSLNVTAVAGLTGTTTITVTARDGINTTTETFLLTVNPPTAPGRAREFAIGRDAGGVSTVRFFNPDQTERFNIAPFGNSFTGGIRTASADFTGDDIADLVVGSGGGTAGHVKVFDGVTGAQIFDVAPFGEGFTRGVVVCAGDMTGDGRAELIITAESGGGARVRIFNGNGFVQLADFLALIGGDGVADTAFRGGGRSAVGDFNGDGFGDLAFAAGTGGGPRVAIFDGKTMASTGSAKLRGDFFAFEPKLRNGTYISAGDIDGDGKAELVCGAGPGGGPRVTVFSGKDLIENREVKLRDFFAGDIDNRGGIRVSVKNLDNDAKSDLLVGAGPGGGSRTTAYLGTTLLSGGTGTLFDFDAFPGFDGGVYVG